MPSDKTPEALRLIEAREKRGFKTARDAARFFGWKYDTYIQHERGERGLKKVAEKYAKAFRVSPGWLLTGEYSPLTPEEWDLLNMLRQLPEDEVRAQRLQLSRRLAREAGEGTPVSPPPGAGGKEPG